jgi:hypothetical protein
VYYKLLHSELKGDIRLFIEMVEREIDAPVKRFLESVKQKLQSGNIGIINILLTSIADATYVTNKGIHHYTLLKDTEKLLKFCYNM